MPKQPDDLQRTARAQANDVLDVAIIASEKLIAKAREDAEKLLKVTGGDFRILEERIKNIQDNVKEIKDKLEKDYVTQDQFDPIKRLVYGTVTTVGTILIGAVLALIIRLK